MEAIVVTAINVLVVILGLVAFRLLWPGRNNDPTPDTPAAAPAAAAPVADLVAAPQTETETETELHDPSMNGARVHGAGMNGAGMNGASMNGAGVHEAEQPVDDGDDRVWTGPPHGEPQVAVNVEVTGHGLAAALVPVTEALGQLGFRRDARSLGIDFTDADGRQVTVGHVAHDGREFLSINAGGQIAPYLAYRLVDALMPVHGG